MKLGSSGCRLENILLSLSSNFQDGASIFIFLVWPLPMYIGYKMCSMDTSINEFLSLFIVE